MEDMMMPSISPYRKLPWTTMDVEAEKELKRQLKS